MTSEKPQEAWISLTSQMLNLCTKLGRTQRSLLNALFDRLATEHEQGLPLGIDDLPWLPPLQVWSCAGVRLIYRVSGNRVQIISIEFDPLPPSGGPAKAGRNPISQSINGYTYWNHYDLAPKRYSLKDSSLKPLVVIVMEGTRMTAVNFTDTLVIQHSFDQWPVLTGTRRGEYYEVRYSYEPEQVTMISSLYTWGIVDAAARAYVVRAAARAYDDAIMASVTRAPERIGMTIDVRDFAPACYPYNPAAAVANPYSTAAVEHWTYVNLWPSCEIARTKSSYDDFLEGSGTINGIGMTIDMQDGGHRIYDLSHAVTNQYFTLPHAVELAGGAWRLPCDFAQEEVPCDDFFEASGISDTNGIDKRIDMHDFAFAFNNLDDLPLAEANSCFTPPRAFGAAAWLFPCERREVMDELRKDTGNTATTGDGSRIELQSFVPVGRRRYDPLSAVNEPNVRTPRTSGFDDMSWCMSPRDIARKKKSYVDDDFLEEVGMAAITGTGTMIDMRCFVPARHPAIPPGRGEMLLQ
jgi:hypothetical protein